MSYNYNMAGIVKPADIPGEFKCTTCQIMWSSYMKNNIPCTDFDFANPVFVEKIGS